jgi:addiction module RelE/StbE family toxin
MPYEIQALRSFDRSLKKLSQDARQHIETAVFDLEHEPRKGEPLRQSLRGFWSLHTRFKNSDYRVLYKVRDENRVVSLYYVASRENFYKQVERLRLKAA